AIALALLQGEEPEELRERWLEAGDTWPLALLAAGAAHIEEYPQERVYEVVVEELERRAKMKRFEVLKNKNARGEATIEEIIEFSKLAKFLKGGQGKHESGK
ncbi:MAG: DNA primase, partial [Thermovirga sp.]|nr:DNA primase [Thermovirga sp.]